MDKSNFYLLIVCLPWLWQWLPVPSELDGHTSGMFVCHPWSEPHTPPPLFLHAVSCGNKSNKYMNKNHLINEAVLLSGIKSWDLLPQSYKSSCTKKLKNGTKNFSAWFGRSISIFQCVNSNINIYLLQQQQQNQNFL